MVLRHPELDLAGLEDDLFGGKPFEDALVVARRLEPIAEKVARGLTFAAVRNVRCAELELEVSSGSTGVVADASSIAGLPFLPRVCIDRCKDKQYISFFIHEGLLVRKKHIALCGQNILLYFS